MQNVDSTQAQH